MDPRFHRLTALSLLAAMLPGAAPAQTAADNAAPARSWQAPLTAGGQPNLQGYWTNDTFTPLERPAALGDKALFTEEEAIAFVKSGTERLNGQAADNIHYDDAIWQAENYGKTANRRTSLIVEPQNGRLPPLTDEGTARLAEQRATQRLNPAASGARSRSLAERCITWGNVGPPMVPPTYNANLEIMQAKDVVIIRHEMMHDTRVIHLDGRGHPPASLQWLAGHSTGRWEGQTLVVDTTNFTPKTNFRGPPGSTRQDIFATEHLHVVERFTPVDENTIRYAFTVDDPATWTSPWSGEMEIRRTADPIYEYACHEGNLGLANILRAAQLAKK
jgi:hypothetical protein